MNSNNDKYQKDPAKKDIKFILGYEGRDELIHKDDLVKINQ